MNQKYSLESLPQADDLSRVKDCVLAISKGKKTDKEICIEIGFSDRQARYYRKSCEILGLISVSSNKTELSNLGKELVTHIELNNEFLSYLRPLILEIPFIRNLVKEMSLVDSLEASSIENYILMNFNIGVVNTTTTRRIHTLIKWLKQINAIEEFYDEKGKKYFKVSKQNMTFEVENLEISYSLENFKKGILSNVETEITIVSNDWENEIQVLLNSKELSNDFRNKNISFVARLVLGISEKTEIDENILGKYLEAFKLSSLTFWRYLIEIERSQKHFASRASTNGVLLESIVKNWADSHGAISIPHYEFEGLSKNVDYFLPEYNVAIECKFTDSAGTKHGGAEDDLKELSRGRKKHSYKLGVAIAGKSYLGNSQILKEFTHLYNKKIIDFIISPSDLEKYSPRDLKQASFISKQDDSLIIENFEKYQRWNEKLTKDELLIKDSALWLQRYANVEYIDKKSFLYTWLYNTPFALNTLRLALNWSDSKLDASLKLIKDSFNEDPRKQKHLDANTARLILEHFIALVDDNQIINLKEFINKKFLLSDLLSARDLYQTKLAQKKKQINSDFCNLCKLATLLPTYEQISTELEIPVTPSFFVQINGVEHKVLCKYYSTSGSVISDLVKTIQMISESPLKDSWIIIVDGAGVWERKADLVRMLTLSESANLKFFNLSQWKIYSKFLEKRILVQS